MRTFLVLCCFLTIGKFNLLAQYDCLALGAADSIQLLYQADAEQLYARHVEREKQKGPEVLPLAQKEIYSVAAALLSIYGDEDLPYWEEIVTQYEIHTQKSTSSRNIRIVVDTSLLWQTPFDFSMVHLESGDVLMDRLLHIYNFQLLQSPSYIQFTNAPAPQLELILQADVPLDINLLVSVMSDIEGVLLVEPYIEASAEEQIVRDLFLDYTDEYMEFTFRVKWDCQGGVNCSNTHDWIYRVYPDCSVSFVREEGALLPVREVDNLLSAGLFPNPTQDYVSVNLLGPTDTDIQVVLLSAMGQVLHSEVIKTQSGLLQLDISLVGQPVGVYFLGFISGNKVFTEKILKE